MTYENYEPIDLSAYAAQVWQRRVAQLATCDSKAIDAVIAKVKVVLDRPAPLSEDDAISRREGMYKLANQLIELIPPWPPPAD